MLTEKSFLFRFRILERVASVLIDSCKYMQFYCQLCLHFNIISGKKGKQKAAREIFVHAWGPRKHQDTSNM